MSEKNIQATETRQRLLTGNVENSYFKVTFCARSDGIFSFQCQNCSVTLLGGDLVGILLTIKRFDPLLSLLHPYFASLILP